MPMEAQGGAEVKAIFTLSKRLVGTIIWNLSELLNIPLGRSAPKVFGWMIGIEGKRMNEEK